MLIGYLIRTQYSATCTLGFLVVDSLVLATLERPWLNNRKNISCIPKGKYLTEYLPRSASGKYKKTYHVSNVSNRSGILIHNGNVVDHTRGCVLIGRDHGILAGKNAVLNSKLAMRDLNEVIGPNGFILTVL